MSRDVQLLGVNVTERRLEVDRDFRIDFFRGFALLSIYIAHIPYNDWSPLLIRQYTPIDSADIFVFCSGLSAAIALGTVFTRVGFFAGCARVVERCWQLYWAQIGIFIVALAACSLATSSLGTLDYLTELNLRPFIEDPGRGVVGLLTLTYVPNYFDILPMYLVLLAMIPGLILLKRAGLVAVMSVTLLLWAMPKLMAFNLPAEWWSDRGWYFNPFVWQLLFVTAFAFSAGWISPPRVSRWLVGAALAYLILMIPLSLLYNHVAAIWDFRDATWTWGWQKSQLGFFRVAYLLALAYLAHSFLRANDRLFARTWAKALIVVGQHALPVFMVSTVLAQLSGMLLDFLGRHHWTSALVNLGGLLVLFGVALLSRYYKKPPWRRPRLTSTNMPEPTNVMGQESHRNTLSTNAHAAQGLP